MGRINWPQGPQSVGDVIKHGNIFIGLFRVGVYLYKLAAVFVEECLIVSCFVGGGGGGGRGHASGGKASHSSRG